MINLMQTKLCTSGCKSVGLTFSGTSKKENAFLRGVDL